MFDGNLFVVSDTNPIQSGGKDRREEAGNGCQRSDTPVSAQVATLRPFPSVVASEDSGKFAQPRRMLNQRIC